MLPGRMRKQRSVRETRPGRTSGVVKLMSNKKGIHKEGYLVEGSEAEPARGNGLI